MSIVLHMSRVGKKNIQIEEDISFQVKLWKFEEISSFIVSTVLVFVFFGFGPMNSTKKSNKSSSVEYKRFSKKGDPTEIVANLFPGNKSKQELLISNAFLKRYKLQGIAPKPKKIYSNNNTLRYIFNTRETSRLSVTLRLVPEKMGNFDSFIGNPHNPVQISQIVLP